MKEQICCNILDFDGVLVPGEDLMDEYIEKVCKEATNKYCEELFRKQTDLIKYQQQLEQERDIYGKEMKEVILELEALKRKIVKHFDFKDQVLEETEDKYRGIIDYKEIYQLKNIYPGVLELIWEIHDKGIYVQQLSNTHVNAETEIIAKRELLKKEFPPMKFIPIKYHSDPYRDQYGLVNRNRKPSDKVGRLLRMLSYVDIPVSTLVDNSVSIIKRGNELGLRSYFVNKEDDPADIIRRAANDTIDIVHEGKIKRLVK